MIFITANLKGGSGKSALAHHVLSQYIRDTTKQETVVLYEFDEHSKSSLHLENSNLVNPKIIKSISIEKALDDIKYEGRTKSIIIDAGARANTIDFLKAAKKNNLVDKFLFVVPYMNDEINTLEETFELIEQHVDKPRIVLALNACPYTETEDIKREFMFLYGNDMNGYEPSRVLKTKMSVGVVPYMKKEIAYARIARKTMGEIADAFNDFSSLNVEDRIKLWSKEDGVEMITMERYGEKKAEFVRQRDVVEKISFFGSIFEALKKVEKANVPDTNESLNNPAMPNIY